MEMMKKTEIVRKLIQEEIEKLGYKLLNIEIKPKWGGRELIITIGKEKGNISIKDCEKVSKKIDPILEGANLFENRWYLSVSSPGANLTQDDFQKLK
ncbi:hypothetical protein H5T58_00715 [Candidatus Parcubacteria bacterium]|nr:hypothetical protein [Candidatus Parcubacteria bacterium]